MEIIIGLALLYGVIKGGEKAVGWAIDYARSAGSKQWKSYASKHPHPKTGRVGRAVGRTLSSGLHGAVASGRGFAAGWRAGWPEGKQAVYDWHDRRHGASPKADASKAKLLQLREAGYDGPIDEHGVAVSDDRLRGFPTGRETTRPAGTPIAVPGRRPAMVGTAALAEQVEDDPFSPRSLADSHIDVDDQGDGQFHVYAGKEVDPDKAVPFTAKSVGEAEQIARRILAEKGVSEGWLTARGTEYDELCVNDSLQVDQPEGLASVTPITGGQGMAIATVTGGETLTFESLIAELKTIAEEATADMEDAQGDAARAKEDQSRVQTMLASLASMDLDEQSLGEISALGEDSNARAAAAEARLKASESRAAHAVAASKGVQERHALMQQAHDETPHAAHNAFYGH
jgi:hypothetical protein